MNQSVATRVYGMQMLTHLSLAAQITFLSMAAMGVVISLLGLVI
jgi:hypothetical protein